MHMFSSLIKVINHKELVYFYTNNKHLWCIYIHAAILHHHLAHNLDLDLEFHNFTPTSQLV